eukprot:12504430-Ditylum_brightwellii.AAC.1
MFSRNGAVLGSMDIDDVANPKGEIDKIKSKMEEMGRDLEESQNMGMNRFVSMFHMMQIQQSKTEEMLAKSLEKIAAMAMAKTSVKTPSVEN